MQDLSQIWNECLDILDKENVFEDQITLESYFRSSSLVEVTNNHAIITTLMKFNIDTILEQEANLNRTLSQLLGKNISIKVMTNEQYNQKDTQESFFPFDTNLNSKMTFENFVVGDSNRMAQNASLVVTQAPGEKFNPLFLYSNPGLGKTHLLNAIGNYALKRNPKLKILYTTSKEFVDRILDSIKSKKSDEIYSFYKNLDILLIDDIQFLFGKEKSSEMFFHIFNEIINNNKQVVITSDKMPDELQGIDSRLISRFKSGLSFGIDPPEFETAKVILMNKFENMGNSSITIEEDVIDFMAANFCIDVRSLQGQVQRLLFVAVLDQKEHIDMEFALKIFKDEKVVKNPATVLNPEVILKTTADFYYLSFNQLTSKNRAQKLVIPREICMYLMRNLLNITYAEIGAIFSHRDHSTIMKACNRVETKIKKDKQYEAAVNKLKRKLGTY